MAETDALVVGSRNLMKYIADGGIDFESNDIDAPNSGRDKDGTMHRLKVARKAKIKVKLRMLTHEELRTVLSAISPNTVQVSYLDPLAGRRSSVFYCSSYSTGTETVRDGATVRKGASFNLIEV